MTMPFPKKPWIRGVLLAGVGAVLVALACWAPGPTDAQDEEVAAVLADSLFADGYIRGIDAKDWQEAIDRFNSAKELDVPEATAQKLNFWLGYALFQQARTDQEPQTLETAQTTLGTFREALRLFESCGDYARANNLEGNLMELVKATGTFIEIQEAIIRRGL